MISKSHDILNEEDGFSLVEALVSMSILVAVLLPVLLFLGYLGNSPQNEPKIQALNIAQTEMEKTLHNQQYEDELTYLQPDSSWIVRREVDKQPPLVAIEINVFRFDTMNALIKLQTERLQYETGE